MTIRTRFAPSPTGFLHIGSARTALFNWAFAKHHAGQFILRIEDTDRERSTDESIEAILVGMQWLQLDSDEPITYQMDRIERYNEVALSLVERGDAYFCNCSKERLTKLRETQMANQQKPRYDGLCRLKNLAPDPDCVIRFKTPQQGQVTFKDQVHGEITVNNDELDDVVLIRSDGIPTYNFSVVVDDLDMFITHVIRGDDHINNTPRQINIIKALDGTIPVYAHVPMILGPDGKRLSKRHGAVSVMQYHEDGFVADAMINYLIRLGWSHGDQEIFSREDIIDLFDLDHVNKAAASINMEKLLWLNQHYLKTTENDRLLGDFDYQLQHCDIQPTYSPDRLALINVQKERCQTMQEMAEKSSYFFNDAFEYDEKAIKKHIKSGSLDLLQQLATAFENITDWQQQTIHHAIHLVAEKNQANLGKIAQPLRIAVTGSTISPAIDITLFLLGKQNTLNRIKKLLNYLDN